MKRSIITMAAALLLAAGASAADITIKATDVAASKVFTNIARQSGKNFIYDPALLRGLNVSIDVSNKPLKETLDMIFGNTEVDYRISGNNITLFRRKRIPRHTISGFVRESGTSEALAGVTLKASPSGAVTTTNAMGFYSITVPSGDITISARYLGFDNYDSGEIALNADRTFDINMTPGSQTLSEVIVTGSHNKRLTMEAPSIGSVSVCKAAIVNTPVIFGEKDVIKTLQLEPGVAAGIEGTAGMYVHGGNSDENLYMLDNIPLYQVNHLGGLFSAFNVEAIRNVDFHKSTFPAKYDGRLSSFMDVNTKDGSPEGHHGTARLGLTSGAFNIDGPLWRDRTTYSLAVRRSWYDVFTLPVCAIVNSMNGYGHRVNVGYAFTDLNAKANHRFSDRSSAFAMFYYGEDYLSVTTKEGIGEEDSYYEKQTDKLRWGNIVAGAGWKYVFSPKIFGEMTAAYTRFQSRLESNNETGYTDLNANPYGLTIDRTKTKNNINDWIFRADFDYRPGPAHKINFGASYTRHSFLPSRTQRSLSGDGVETTVADHTPTYRADELNAYAGGDLRFEAFRIGYGLHYSLFSIGGDSHGNLSPRIALRWAVSDRFAVKGGYSRTVQYVHQLLQSSISLPTDQWVPIVGNQKPQTADKISAGFYYDLGGGMTLAAEGYWKWMDNLLDFSEAYYLLPPETAWHDKLTQGSGTSRGIDLKLSRETGRITGHISYSLMWADRRFDNLNGGRKFPARFDNRHKINILVNYKINDRWEVGAAWTGMSGNHITLPLQNWNDPLLGPWHYDMSLATEVNNYRLPFYHRLDLSARRHTKNGYWEFSLYNAYCNMNTIGVRRDISNKSWSSIYGYPIYKPTFQKIRLIPTIPSASYTWLF